MAAQPQRPGPEAAAALATFVVDGYPGDVAAAFTVLCGALILTAGSMRSPLAMYDVAIEALTSARAKHAAHRDTSPPAEVP